MKTALLISLFFHILIIIVFSKNFIKNDLDKIEESSIKVTINKSQTKIKKKDIYIENSEIFDQEDYDQNIRNGEWDDDYQGNCPLNIGM